MQTEHEKRITQQEYETAIENVRKLYAENKRLREVLQKARNGIEWFMSGRPLEVSDADHDMLREIDEALRGCFLFSRLVIKFLNNAIKFHKYPLATVLKLFYKYSYEQHTQTNRKPCRFQQIRHH